MIVGCIAWNHGNIANERQRKGTDMKDKKLQESINYVCFCCPYIDTETDVSDKYCDRCMVRKMVDYYDALEKHPFDVDMPEVQAIINY